MKALKNNLSPSPELITAYLPNPGRLIEILIPGRKLILEQYHNLSAHRGIRKTKYTVVAAYYRGQIVPLYSARANLIAKELIIPRLFPHTYHLKVEVKYRNSRIDFSIHYSSTNMPQRMALIEVKACTLIEENIAMFPDAPTERGKKHLRELANAPMRSHIVTSKDINTNINVEAHVIFVIMNPEAKEFIPNIHTDPEFAQLVFKLRQSIKFHAISIKTDKSGNVTIFNDNLPVNFEKLGDILHLQHNKPTHLSGIYMLNIEIEEDTEIEVGALGKVNFKRGFYIYVGSAMGNLTQRIERHRKKAKKLRWHIDYLTVKAKKITSYPIITSKKLECTLALTISKIAQNFIPKFGSSDCNCPSHLFYFSESPEKNQRFINILFHFRHKLAL